jgi:uncharacterized membrane protein
MGFDSSRLRWPERIVGAGGLVLLASMLLLPWYTLTQGSPPPGPRYFVTTSVDGWNGLSHGHWLILATILLAFALVFFQATRRAPAIPVVLSVLTPMLGSVTVLWLIYRVLISPPGGERKAGAIIGLLSACVIVYGGYSSLRRDGIAPADGPSEIPTIRVGAKGDT